MYEKNFIEVSFILDTYYLVIQSNLLFINLYIPIFLERINYAYDFSNINKTTNINCLIYVLCKFFSFVNNCCK